MKKLLIILSISTLGTLMGFGQNYIGIRRTMMLVRFGIPDEKGKDFFTYSDKTEEGTNTYYFDEHNKCNSFVIERTTQYYDQYKTMLTEDFTVKSDNTYICKSKNFRAEVNKSATTFTISITLYTAYKDINLESFAGLKD